MRTSQLLRRSLLCAIVVGSLTTHALAADTANGVRIENIVPEPSDPVDHYEGTLDPNNALTGTLTHPADAFDWWCLSVQAGTPLQITIHGSAGARPNCGLVQDVVADGAPFEDLGPLLGATNNGTSEDVTFTVTPTFSGRATVFIANAGTGFNVQYSVSMSGGTANQSCNPCPDCPANPAVDYNEKVRFVVGTQRTISANEIEIPLLVDCGEQVEFTRMTVEYDSADLTFLNATIGSGVSGAGAVTSLPATPTVLNAARTVLASGEYGPGCRMQVFLLRFQLSGTATPPCQLVLNRVTGIANPPNHVIADLDGNHVGDRQLVGDANGFCDGVVDVSDIAVDKSVDNASPTEGSTIHYSIMVTNNGPSLATGIVISDVLDSRLTFVSSSATQGSYSSATKLWTVGSLSSPGSATLTITATVNAGTAGQTIPNTALKTAVDQLDPVAGNDTDTQNIQVQGADIGMTKTVSNLTPNVGGSITYTVLASNAGPNSATNLVVTDLLPAGVTYVSHTTTQGTYVPGTGVWTVGTVASAGSATLTITATVTGTPGQVITNTAVRTSADQADPVTSNNTGSVVITVQSADIGITKTVSNLTPNVGGSITYTVLASNAGPNSATNLVVTDLLPAGVTYVSHTTTQGTYVPGTGVWTVGTVASAGSATLQITATVNAGAAGQMIVNVASRTSVDQADPVSGNNSHSATVNVGCADVNVTGTVRYYSNGRNILPNVPDLGTAAVVVRDCNNGAVTSTATNATYDLAYGNGPITNACVCASRPKANCNGLEGGVISGSDLILVEDWVAGIGSFTAKQKFAADTNGDGELFLNDPLAIAQWIGHAAVCDGNTCLGMPGDNCVGTWKFLYPTGPGPNDFVPNQRCFPNVCVDQTANCEGALVGDADGSWPNIFPTLNVASDPSRPQAPGITIRVVEPADHLLDVVVSARASAVQALHHLTYSLEYDPQGFECLGATLGADTQAWGLFDNPAQAGVTHGIAYRLGGRVPLQTQGDVLVFHFRARTTDAEPRFTFSRLKANDLDVQPDNAQPATPLPSQFAMNCYPNPFNPSTQIRFAIPESAGEVPVTVQIYNIGGRVIRKLLQDRRRPGFHAVEWNGKDDSGTGVGSGIYFVHVRAGAWSRVTKVALLK